ncbi:MAG TPA: geranylgeranyl reductase family protein, partial [Acidimicrobiia bacterium]
MGTAQQYDLIVVGAGPAGTAAAIEARRHGLSVSVVDRATFPRDKTCGDGLTTNALRVLQQLGLARDALTGDGGYERVDDVVLVQPNGREIALPLPRGHGDFAAVVTRVRLDAALVDLARARGAQLRLGHSVVAIDSGAGEISVELGDGASLRAPWVIAADGHWSPTRRMLEPGAPRDLGAWHAARQYFSGVADRRLWVLFERDLLPGYAWVFPLPGGRANVGYGVLREEARRGRDLKALWCDVVERPSIRRILGATARPEGPMRAWPIPTDFTPAALHHGRVLFAGDAARVVDPMTGEGIAQALETGMLAAAAVAGVGNTDTVTAGYEHSVRTAIGRDLRFAARLQRVLGSQRGAQLALRAVDANAWTRRNFARW